MMVSEYFRVVPASIYRASLSASRWVAWAGAALLTAWVLSGWFWGAMTPGVQEGAARTPSPAEPVVAAQAVAARHLLGGDAGSNPAGTPQFQLLGAMTASGKAPGFAILAENGKSPQVVVEGETFTPGVKLLQVLPRQVRLETTDRVETLELRDAAGSPAANGVTIIQAAPKRAAAAPNPIPARKNPQP